MFQGRKSISILLSVLALMAMTTSCKPKSSSNKRTNQREAASDCAPGDTRPICQQYAGDEYYRQNGANGANPNGVNGANPSGQHPVNYPNTATNNPNFYNPYYGANGNQPGSNPSYSQSSPNNPYGTYGNGYPNNGGGTYGNGYPNGGCPGAQAGVGCGCDCNCIPDPCDCTPPPCTPCDPCGQTYR